MRHQALAQLAVLGPLLLLQCVSGPATRIVVLPAESVARWTLLGRGEVGLPEPGTLRLTEGRNSGGVVLLSPQSFPRDVVLRFEARPERADGVNVVFLSVSPVEGAKLTVPEDYDGAFSLWNGPEARARSYTFGFHTGYHQPNAFVWRNPGSVELAAAPDLASGESWHAVEIGRRGQRVWLSVDGAVVLEADETGPPLPSGRIGIRLRGPGDGSYACRFRHLSVEVGR